ncbi:cell wall-binding repeat-containing protein, partial [Cellulomonas cellasea]
MSVRPARRPLPLGRLGLGAAVVVGLIVTGCVAGQRPAPTDGTPTATASPAVLAAAVQDPAQALTLAADEAADAVALAASRTLYAQAPVVVLASAADVPGQLAGASAAVAWGVPVLLTGGAADAEVAAELERLGAQAVLLVGGATAPDGPDAVAVPVGEAVGSALAEATGLRFGEERVVEAGQELAAVAALGRPATAVLTVAGAASGAASGGDPD